MEFVSELELKVGVLNHKVPVLRTAPNSDFFRKALSRSSQ